MAYKLVLVLTLHCLVQVLYSKEHLVQTNCRSHSNSCRTFNDYANDADTYFTSDSSFNFMKGTHHLNVTLFITNVTNLGFVGDKSDIILSNGCSIIWTNSSKLFWTSLNLLFKKAYENTNYSAIHFGNSENVIFSDASFFKIYCEHGIFSRAILVVGSSIIFENCKFENGYHSTGGTLYIKDSNVTFGGHNVFLNNTANNSAGAMYGLRSKIQLSGNNTFIGNRVGMDYGHHCNGTAIHVEFSSISLNGYFKFLYNQIIENSVCFYSFGSGGAIAASYSTLTMQGVFYFINNSNCYGGAIFLLNSECLISGHVEFEGNVAFDGGAIYARHSFLIVKSKESYSYNNSGYNNSESFSTSAYPKGVILFYSNSAGRFGGAVDLSESSMTLTGSVVLLSNKANHGGGINIHYIYDSRKCHSNFIILQEPLDLLFHSNFAKRFGGALYVNDANSGCRQWDTRYYFYCFFRVNGSMRYIKLNFTGNKALKGTGIYGGAIQYCEVEVRNQRQRGYIVLQNLTKTSTAIQNEYASDIPYEIRLCNGSSITNRVQRGQVFNISVTILGEFDIPVYESVAFTIDPYTSSEVVGQPYNYLNEKGCRNLGFSIQGEYRTNIMLHLPQCFDKPGSLRMTIYLDDCPPGFMQIKKTCKCQENIFKVTGHDELCDSSTGLIKCPQQDWMKPILDENLTYEGFMWSPNCPAHLCCNDKDNWLDFSSDNVDFLCLEYRTAMLCGACLQTYSLMLSSLKCSKCDSNNHLSLLLVFALAGVALIASSLFFHITIVDGTINGLIFYANIINIIKDIIFSQDKLPPNPLTIFLSWLNLDFGIPTCFYTGLTYYSYTWLQFVFPLYLWFLVGLIILACKYSSRAMKLFGSNPVAVLATVVLMSYSKLLHTSQQILSYVTVYYSDGTQEKRWKLDPTLLYLQGKHIPLALFCIFIVITFLVPYIVLLSFGHYLQKYSNKKGLKWLAKIKPILDAYYAPFYKNTRYWVGFQIFVRTSLSITHAALKNTEHITTLGAVLSVLAVIALIPWMQQRIYQKKWANIFEGSFILNIIILVIMSLATYTTKEFSKNQFIKFYTSIGIAFIEFLAILIFHAWHRLNLKWLYMRYFEYCRNDNAEVLPNSKYLDEPGGNVATTMVFDIREPLLDDSSTTEL